MLVDERTYWCRKCGRHLFRSDVPLGTRGVVLVPCPERLCQRTNAVKVGEPPLPRPNRQQAIHDMRMRRSQLRAS
jgi:hypothetical protein